MVSERGTFDPSKHAVRLLRQTLDDLSDIFEAALDVTDEDKESGFSTLLRWAQLHPKWPYLKMIVQENENSIERLLRMCKDIAKSIINLLESTGMSVSASPFVLLRSLGEAVTTVCYIMDGTQPPVKTCLRMAAYQLATCEGGLKANAAFGQTKDRDEARLKEAVVKAHSWFNEAGFELKPVPRKELRTASISFDGTSENLQINATDAFNTYQPGSSWQWETGSGVAHAKGWALASIISTQENRAQATPTQSVLATALPMLELADALAIVAASHTGISVERFHKKNHLRRQALMNRGGRTGHLATDYKEYARRDLSWRPEEVQKPFWGTPTNRRNNPIDG